jgi:hypothetical protein
MNEFPLVVRGLPLIVSVCQDCEQTVRDVVLDAYMAGQASVLLEARLANAYWAKQLEELLHRE